MTNKIIFTIFMIFSISAVADVSNDLHKLASSYRDSVLSVERNKFLTNTPQALKNFHQQEDAIFQSLQALDTTALKEGKERIFYLKFMEYINASIGVRICRDELWNLDPIRYGTHFLIDQLVESQPVAAQEDKKQALLHWREIGTYYQQEIINLNEGLKLGYTAPKRVVKRVIQQINNIVEADIDSHPYLKLAERSTDEEFQRAFKAVVEHHVLPALRTYADYLQKIYLVKTRDELGLHANTHGRECYLAKYRYHTSLQRSPEQIYNLGIKTVNRQEQEVTAIGKRLYGVNTFEATLKKVNEDNSERFDDADSMHQLYQEVITRAERAMPQVFNQMPAIGLEILPVSKHKQGTGINAGSYEPGYAGNTGRFIYDPAYYKFQTIGNAEILSVHEGYPGHHMQIGLEKEQQLYHPIEELFTNSAFTEGWARYAETLSEELGIYHTNSALIYRRAWPARGMVADPALHLLGWSNEDVKQYLTRSGRMADPDQMLDRMAVWPAQLTAYDSGALEIFALRTLAEKKLGDRFDLKSFHHALLKNGNLPLSILRTQIESWIKNNEGQ